jgi:hypothetical protein
VSAAPSANTPATSTTRPHRREAAALTRASRLSVLWSPGVSYGRANGLAPIREARSPIQLTPACATMQDPAPDGHVPQSIGSFLWRSALWAGIVGTVRPLPPWAVRRTPSTQGSRR